MEIPNLNPTKPTINSSHPISLPLIGLIVFLSLSIGFWGSRFFPLNSTTSSVSPNALVINPESIQDSSQLEANKLYGNLSKSFKDTATGVLEKGSINGEGTHILVREGGLSQRASLTSSVIDLDLFVGKKVEVKGETNASTKTSWLMDVGTIKIIE